MLKPNLGHCAVVESEPPTWTVGAREVGTGVGAVGAGVGGVMEHGHRRRTREGKLNSTEYAASEPVSEHVCTAASLGSIQHVPVLSTKAGRNLSVGLP